MLIQLMKRAWSSPAVIVVAAFAVRMGFLVCHEVSLPTPDMNHLPIGYETGSIARSIAAGAGFSSPLGVETGPTAWLTPVYPCLTAGVFKLFGIFTYSSNLVILALNCFFSALTCWVLVSVGRRTFGAAVGTWAGWGWAFLPSAIFFSTNWVWDTSLSALLLSLLVWATLALRDSMQPGGWLGYGALWAFAALTNPSVLSLLPLFLGWLVLQAKQERKTGVRWATAAALTFLVGVTPWFVRNYLVFGKFVFFRSNFGLELYLGNNENVPDAWSWWLHPNENDEEKARFRQLGEIAYMAEKQRLATRFMLDHPGDVARFLLHRFGHTWTGTTEPLADVWPRMRWNVKAGLLFNCLFSVLALAGVLFANRARAAPAFLFGVVLLVFPVVYYVTHTAPRYRHPIDPIMTLLAVYTTACLLARLRAKTLRPAAGARPD